MTPGYCVSINIAPGAASAARPPAASRPPRGQACTWERHLACWLAPRLPRCSLKETREVPNPESPAGPWSSLDTQPDGQGTASEHTDHRPQTQAGGAVGQKDVDEPTPRHHHRWSVLPAGGVGAHVAQAGLGIPASNPVLSPRGQPGPEEPPGNLRWPVPYVLGCWTVARGAGRGRGGDSAWTRPWSQALQCGWSGDGPGTPAEANGTCSLAAEWPSVPPPNLSCQADPRTRRGGEGPRWPGCPG